MSDDTNRRPLQTPADRRGVRLGLVHLATVGAFLVAASCHGAESPEMTRAPGVQEAAEAGDRLPVIQRIAPPTGWAGQDYPLEATVHGTGFSESGNVIAFGSISIEDLPSTDEGTQITFPVPKQQRSGIEVPPMVLPVGEYSVTVTTVDGTSNAITFTLTRPGSAPQP